jgi:hypothetical protein
VLYLAQTAVKRQRASRGEAVVNIIANICGALGAIVFVGYFAYKVDELPLTVIVTVCLALMVYSFYDDIRIEQAKARGENGK